MAQFSTLKSLYNKCQCPHCNFIFVAGYTNTGNVKCPTCKQSFNNMKETGCTGDSCPAQDSPTTLALPYQSNYTGSNNMYYKIGCPALMSDGRFITYHGSTNELTDALRKKYNFTNSNDFRTFFLTNADKMINDERRDLINKNTCKSKIGCSQGWNELWNVNGGNWSNLNSNPVPFNS